MRQYLGFLVKRSNNFKTSRQKSRYLIGFFSACRRGTVWSKHLNYYYSIKYFIGVSSSYKSKTRK